MSGSRGTTAFSAARNYSFNACVLNSRPFSPATVDMPGEYTCGRCLQVLQRRLSTQCSTFQLQTVVNLPGPRNSPSFSRRFSSQSNNRLPPQSSQGQLKRTSCPSLSPSSAASPTAKQLTHRASSTSSSQAQETRTLLKPNNLFHPFSKSPAPAIRQRAAFIKQNAFCPHPSHQQTRAALSPHDPESRKSPEGVLPPAHSHFECPDCGVPIYCSEEHWMDDFEAHLEICDTIRQINEDDHDLHSGRFFPEFTYPGLQDDNFVINMTNWDTFLYTREFDAINHDRSMRQVTRMLTYPLTIGSVLHELSPYSVRKGGRLTTEGLKSVSGKLHLSVLS